jgi:hypothetical protein
MHEHYGAEEAGIHLNPEKWHDAFRTQTGQSLNVAENGIAKLILISDSPQDRNSFLPFLLWRYTPSQLFVRLIVMFMLKHVCEV